MVIYIAIRRIGPSSFPVKKERCGGEVAAGKLFDAEDFGEFEIM